MTGLLRARDLRARGVRRGYHRGSDRCARDPRDDPAGATRPPLRSDRQWRVVAEQSGAQQTATLTPQAPVTTRFVLVYLTSLPREGGRYRGGISEVEVRLPETMLLSCCFVSFMQVSGGC